MSAINLSKEYLQYGNPSVIERVQIWKDPDVYWASSLIAIENHFQTNPPQHVDFFSRQSAFVLVRGVWIKRYWPDSFDEDNEVSLRRMGEGLCLPLFVLKDSTTTRLAYWKAGHSNEYVQDQQDFGFNRQTFVPIPKLWLKYTHDEYRGDLDIKALEKDDRVRRVNEGLCEKIQQLLPELVPAPQPA